MVIKGNEDCLLILGVWFLISPCREIFKQVIFLQMSSEKV